MNEDSVWRPVEIKITIESYGEFMALEELFGKDISVPNMMQEKYNLSEPLTGKLKEFFKKMYSNILKAKRINPDDHT
jgi:hypothetical protein